MALAEAGARGRLLLWPRVVLFGDSITEFSFQENGWGASLAERLVRKCDVVNRGLSGYNTRWAKLILPRLIAKSTSAESTVAVTIFFGANDSALKDLNPKQHVPLEEYAANLKSMIQYLKSVDITEDRIILITPPPLQESAWEKECLAKGDKLNRRNATTGEYAQACVQVARDCGTDVLDLWTLMQKDQDFSSYLSDGLHLSTKGNSFLAAQLWSCLEKNCLLFPCCFLTGVTWTTRTLRPVFCEIACGKELEQLSLTEPACLQTAGIQQHTVNIAYGGGDGVGGSPLSVLFHVPFSWSVGE